MQAGSSMDVRAVRLPGATPSVAVPEAFGPRPTGAAHIFVIVNVPEPVQPVPPIRVQLPEMVFPLTVPVSESVLPAGVPDVTVMPNEPFTWPLKFPLSVKDPDSVSPETKHDELVVNLKFVTFSDPSALTARDVPNVKTGVLLPLLI